MPHHYLGIQIAAKVISQPIIFVDTTLLVKFAMKESSRLHHIRGDIFSRKIAVV